MGLFGFKSKKEVEEEKRKAAAEAARRVEENNLTNLTNLSTGSQVNIAIPYFDVFDPRLTDTGVPVSVHGSIVYAIEDLDMFHSINKREAYSDETFQNKLRGTVTKFVKSVVSNAPSDANIPVVQIERKVLEISNLVENYIVPKVEALFGVKVRSFDITAINVDKDSRGYRELKAITADLEQERIKAKHNSDLNAFNTQSDLNVDALKRQHEMSFGNQEELQRMNLEHQRETMRIQREEMQRASRLQTEQTFLGAHQANLNANVLNNAADNGLDAFQTKSSMGMPQMPGVGMGMPGMGAPSMPAEPNVQYMVGVNGQQAGPFNWQQMKQLVQQGQLTAQSYVWKQGMPQWALAGQVMELQPL
ncbi:MAG: GYF domain-containing protein, partial [Muribaculaceae bacterium]|nr:GYF domain-containing protein [Muribaculaceae bacterium]